MTALLSKFQARSYCGQLDLPAIADLINLCKQFDHLEDFTSAEELEHEFADPDLDLDRDLRLWETADGVLCAFADCWLPESNDIQNGYLFFNIHPDFRNLGIEAEVFAWAEARLVEVARSRNLPAKLHTGAREDQSERLTWLKQHNFSVVRYFYRMTRSLLESIAQPQLPEGFSIRPLQGEAEVEDWVEMFNQTFIDHWNFHPMTPEKRLYWMSEAAYQPDIDLVAVAPDGNLAAFSYCVINQQENARKGRNEGWIADLGTRRGYRKQGLGRAMLLHSLQVLKAKGMETAILAVDSENPSGALGLYESVGFRKLYAFVSCAKEIAV